MTVVPRTQQGTRLYSLDALRALLVAWIIGGHALLGYSAVGGWAYDEVNEVTFTTSVELVLAAIFGPSALFFMGTFFLIAGLLTPRSLRHKGASQFVAGRILRLGVPFLVSAAIVWPLVMWLAYLSSGQTVSYSFLLSGRERVFDSGALWFAEVLLIFSLVYAGWRWVADRRENERQRVLHSVNQLWVLAVLLALTTFLLRVAIPARASAFGDVHLWQWPQLGAMFGFGVLFASSGLAEQVPHRLRRASGMVTLATLIIVPVLALVIGVDNLAADMGPFLGGWNWQSALLATVESVLVVFGSVWLLGIAQQRLIRGGKVRDSAIRSSFAAFVLQGPVLIMLAIALRPMPAPAEVKAPLVGAIGIVACFGLGWILISRTKLGRLL
ncbi:acyltransferase family protein [Haloechinothrix halophila]|uniref:acyltransferase family protein n=1 Tax=Haloechinothrix halophila TaxID=1069073 RepID=UPI00040BD769|nr:acyltransferase [Haloechinothrix halophila]